MQKVVPIARAPGQRSYSTPQSTLHKPSPRSVRRRCHYTMSPTSACQTKGLCSPGNDCRNAMTWLSPKDPNKVPSLKDVPVNAFAWHCFIVSSAPPGPTVDFLVKDRRFAGGGLVEDRCSVMRQKIKQDLASLSAAMNVNSVPADPNCMSCLYDQKRRSFHDGR